MRRGAIAVVAAMMSAGLFVTVLMLALSEGPSSNGSSSSSSSSPRPPALCHLPEFHPPEEPIDMPRYHGPSEEFPDRFTLVLNSYKRPKLLQQAVARYSLCKAVDAIRVVWCEEGLPPTRADTPEHYSEDKEVRYDIMPNSSLNSRFWPLEGLRTEAVLSLDDDIVAPCSVLDQLFEAWRENKRNLVGFYPRLHVVDSDCRYKYLLGFGTLAWHGRYSMVLTKAAMLHKDYLEYYTNHMPMGIREHVDKAHNCEDIAMQLLVGNATGKPPVFMHSAKVIDLGKGLMKVKGISSGNHHSEVRSDCLNVFTRFFGGALPLVERDIRNLPDAWALRMSPITDALYSLFTGHI